MLYPANDFLTQWGLTLGSLCAALALLKVYYRVLGSDLTLHSLPKEIAIALGVSLAQAGIVWFLAGLPLDWDLLYDQTGMVFPEIIPVVVYRLTHLTEDMSHLDVVGIAATQLALGVSAQCLLAGAYGFAAFVLGLLAMVAFVIGIIVRED